MITELYAHKSTRMEARRMRQDKVLSIHRQLADGTYRIEERLSIALNRLIDRVLDECEPEIAMRRS